MLANKSYSLFTKCRYACIRHHATIGIHSSIASHFSWTTRSWACFRAGWWWCCKQSYTTTHVRNRSIRDWTSIHIKTTWTYIVISWRRCRTRNRTFDSIKANWFRYTCIWHRTAIHIITSWTLLVVKRTRWRTHNRALISIISCWAWNFMRIDINYTMRKNLPKTLDQLIFCRYTLHFEEIY